MRQAGRRMLSQAEIEEAIVADLDQLEEVTSEYRDAVEKEARTEATYKRKRARAFASANGSVRDKEAFSDEETDEEFLAYKLAEAEAKAVREVLRMLHARLENYRSLNANMRYQP